MKPVNLDEKLSTFTEYWQPRTVGEFNGHDLMVVKVKGAFVWHKHDKTDDFFLVSREESPLKCGEPLSVQQRCSLCKGVEHCPWLRKNRHPLRSNHQVHQIRETLRPLRLGGWCSEMPHRRPTTRSLDRLGRRMSVSDAHRLSTSHAEWRSSCLTSSGEPRWPRPWEEQSTSHRAHGLRASHRP